MGSLVNAEGMEAKAVYDHYKPKLETSLEVRREMNRPFVFGPEKSTGQYCIMFNGQFKTQDDVLDAQSVNIEQSKKCIPLKLTEVNFLREKYPQIKVHTNNVYGIVKTTAGSAFAFLPLFWTVIHEAGFEFKAKPAGATAAVLMVYCPLVYGIFYTAMSKKDPIAYPPMEAKHLFKIGLEIAATLVVALCGLTLTADDEGWLSSFYSSALYAGFEIIILGLNHGSSLLTHFSTGDFGHYLTKIFSEMTNFTVLVGFYKMIQEEIAKIPLGTYPQLAVGAAINLAYFAVFFRYVQPSINTVFKKISEGIYNSYTYCFPRSTTDESARLLESV